MIVVADTSPLNYLIQIECDHLLAELYKSVLIPPGVMTELRRSGAPEAVRTWLSEAHPWIVLEETLSPPDDALSFLDLGEREAIQLAKEKHADLLLIDERRGRNEASRRGIRTTGTLGVLLSANELQLIDAEACYQRLIQDTSFRISQTLEAQFLNRIGH